MKNKSTLFLAQAAMIAALYVVLTFVFAPISFREVQVRVAEALTILPVFTPAAVPGLFIGCLLANVLGGAMIPDVIFGSLATLIGAFFTWKLRRASPYLAPIPPILSNTLIIPFVLRYAYLIEMPIPLMMLTIFFGEVISCGLLGILLYFALDKKRDAIFRIDNH
ncbi:MAG: QueT transporter family protein [Oscillospiraceae bacterium]|nr:QueT transporter family protein [Oscillospiraceae bacterium]